MQKDLPHALRAYEERQRGSKSRDTARERWRHQYGTASTVLQYIGT
jgi:hypothetical protein